MKDASADPTCSPVPASMSIGIADAATATADCAPAFSGTEAAAVAAGSDVETSMSTEGGTDADAAAAGAWGVPDAGTEPLVADCASAAKRCTAAWGRDSSPSMALSRAPSVLQSASTA